MATHSHARLFAELSRPAAPPRPPRPARAILIHCTDCHAVTPAVASPAEPTSCPVCNCPRVFEEEKR